MDIPILYRTISFSKSLDISATIIDFATKTFFAITLYKTKPFLQLFEYPDNNFVVDLYENFYHQDSQFLANRLN